MLCCDGCKEKIKPKDIVTKTQEAECDDFGALIRKGPEKIFCEKCMNKK